MYCLNTTGMTTHEIPFMCAENTIARWIAFRSICHRTFKWWYASGHINNIVLIRSAFNFVVFFFLGWSTDMRKTCLFSIQLSPISKMLSIPYNTCMSSCLFDFVPFMRPQLRYIQIRMVNSLWWKQIECHEYALTSYHSSTKMWCETLSHFQFATIRIPI